MYGASSSPLQYYTNSFCFTTPRFKFFLTFKSVVRNTFQGCGIAQQVIRAVYAPFDCTEFHEFSIHNKNLHPFYRLSMYYKLKVF